MWKEHPLFRFQKPLREQLLSYGFLKEKSRFSYSRDIMDGSLSLYIYVLEDDSVELQVLDKSSGEDYALAYVDTAVGAYVGAVREACDGIIREVISCCFREERSQYPQTRELLTYIRQRYSVEPEYLWTKSPSNAIFREGKRGKWFAALLLLEGKKLGLSTQASLEVLNLKERSEELSSLLDGENYLPGFHMNKKHWYTVPLDGRIPTEELFRRIDRSYHLVSTK